MIVGSSFSLIRKPAGGPLREILFGTPVPPFSLNTRAIGRAKLFKL
jgi:hypothetical protein